MPISTLAVSSLILCPIARKGRGIFVNVVGEICEARMMMCRSALHLPLLKLFSPDAYVSYPAENTPGESNRAGLLPHCFLYARQIIISTGTCTRVPLLLPSVRKSSNRACFGIPLCKDPASLVHPMNYLLPGRRRVHAHCHQESLRHS